MARLLVLGLLVLLGGCQLLELDRQYTTAQRELLLVPGTLQGAEQALVALLDPQNRLLAYRIVQPGGLFYFSMPAGDYQLLAFSDRNGNLRLDADESYRWLPQAATNSACCRTT